MTAPPPRLRGAPPAAILAVGGDDAAAAALAAECERLRAALEAARAERDRAQQQLHRYVEDLLRVNQQRKSAMEAARRATLAQNRFLGEVSHELRGPMATIVGFSELLARGPEPGRDDRVDFADRIRRAALRLNGLVDQVVEATRHGGAAADEAPSADVAAVVTAAVDALRPQAAAHGAAIGVEMPPVLAPAALDGRRLGAAITTLVEDRVQGRPGAPLMLTVHADTGGGLQALALRVGAAAQASAGGTRLGQTIAGALFESLGLRLVQQSLPGGEEVFHIERGPIE